MYRNSRKLLINSLKWALGLIALAIATFYIGHTVEVEQGLPMYYDWTFFTIVGFSFVAGISGMTGVSLLIVTLIELYKRGMK